MFCFQAAFDAVLSAGIEPASEDPESPVLSVELQELTLPAVGTGFEPVVTLRQQSFSKRPD